MPNPDQLLAHAAQLHAAGNLADAEKAYRAAIVQDPSRIEASAGLGILLSQTGNHDEALQLLPHDLVFRANLPLLLVARGTSLLATKNPDDAITCLHRATQLDPNSHEAHNTLGCALLSKKRYLEAITALRRATQLHPAYAEAYFNLGLTLFSAGMYEESAALYLKATQLRPYPQAHLNRGFALRKSHDLDAAILAFHEALLIEPNSDAAMHNLGATLADAGRLPEALTWLRRALAANPKNHHAHSALIYLMNFDPNTTQDQLTTEQQSWQDHHVRGIGVPPMSNAAILPAIARSTGFSLSSTQSPPLPVSPSPRLPSRPLRLAYISPDFRAHAIARFLLPLLENHNRQKFEIHLYASVHSPDDTTEKFQKLADRWHDVLHLSDHELAKKIRDDKIDILIDLTMHMEDNRLLTLAAQPAPTQISWLAYPGTTGLDAIQYHITDNYLDRNADVSPAAARSTGFSLSPPISPSPFLPVSLSPDLPLSASTPLRLPNSWSCYQPDRAAPPVTPLPALTSSHLTFASLNAFRKMNPQVIDLWARTLTAVAESQSKTPRLILSCPQGRHRNDLLHAFATRGILPAQIELLPHMPYAHYMQTYNRIDIALDPFPHNGATTTLDALHMGVPVLALSSSIGTAPIPHSDPIHNSSFIIHNSSISPSRLAASILTTANLQNWLATSPEDFIQKALHHTQNLTTLSTLRATLRDHLQSTPLTNAAQFAQNFEQALFTAYADIK